MNTTTAYGGFKAYARDHVGEIGDGAGWATAQLIDLNNRSARLRLAGAQLRYSKGRSLQVRIPCKAGTALACPASLETAAAVDWVQEDEIGLQFLHALDYGVSELQQMVG